MINTSYQLAPWADILYACDYEWWEEYIDKVKSVFKGKLLSQDLKAIEFGVEHVKGERARGLGKTAIHFGGNSGYQAVNLCYLLDAKKIYLLGYDMRRTEGKSHWHGDHKGRLNRMMPVQDWVTRFTPLAKDLEKEGVEVINITRQTALKCFKQGVLDVELA